MYTAGGWHRAYRVGELWGELTDFRKGNCDIINLDPADIPRSSPGTKKGTVI